MRFFYIVLIYIKVKDCIRVIAYNIFKMYNVYMGKFDLFNKFNNAVIVLQENGEAVFRNNVFKRIFADFDNIQKFSHKLNYNVCALVSNDVNVHSPILQALSSPQDFSAPVLYQTINNDFFYYDMNAIKKGVYTILFFTDVTAKISLENVLNKSQNYSKKITILENENKNLVKVKQQAQLQAMKLLLMNNISNIIRESLDASVILYSALEELAEMFGAFRAYYAEVCADKFLIKQSIRKIDLSKEISFDSSVNEFISLGKVTCQSCRKEYQEAKPFDENVQRIIIPIHHMNKVLGIIVLSTKQKTKLNDTLEFLEGISIQLGNAIIQADLYKKNAQMVKDLTKTLKELQEKNNFLNSELSKKITSLSRYDELSYSLMDLVNEKMQIQDCIEESIKETELLKQTLKFLIKADENLKSKYRQPLTEALNRYLQLLTDVNKTLNIDIELKVTVEEKGGAKQVDFYSKGWQNIFEICKRFALTDVLFPEDKPFIILDDPFYNLDNAKLESALKLVNELSKDYQIIYLTCHNSRAV